MDIHLFATKRNQVFVAITILLVGMLMVSTSGAAPPTQQPTPTYKWTDTPIPTNTPTAAPTSVPKRQPTPQPTPVPVLLPESGGIPMGISIPSLLLVSIGIILCILLTRSLKHPY